MRILDILKEKNLSTQEVLVKVNGEIKPETYEIKNGDSIEIIFVNASYRKPNTKKPV